MKKNKLLGVLIILLCLVVLIGVALFGIYIMSSEEDNIQTKTAFIESPTALPATTPLQTTSAEIDSDVSYLYKNSKHGFSIQYKGDWKKHTNILKNTNLLLLPKDSDPNDVSRAGLSVTIQEMPPEVEKVEQLLQGFNLIYNQMFYDYKLESVSLTQLSGYEAQEMLFTIKIDNKKHRMIQTHFLKNGKIYAISYGGVVSEYNLYYDDYEEMKNSFKITK